MMPLSADVPDRFYPVVEEKAAAAGLAVLEEVRGQAFRAAAERGLAGDAALDFVAEAETGAADRVQAAIAEARAAAEAEPGPCYLLKMPAIWERSNYQAAVRRHGGRPVSQEEFRRVLRDGVRELVVAEQIDRCLSIIEAYEHDLDEMVKGGEAPGFARLARDYQQIVDSVERHYEPYADLIERQVRFNNAASISRVQLFVLGVEGEGAPKLERTGGQLTDRSVDRIRVAGHLEYVSGRLLSLLMLDPDTVGNSVSPAPSSPPGRAILPAAIAAPPGPGSSLVEPTEPTRH